MKKTFVLAMLAVLSISCKEYVLPEMETPVAENFKNDSDGDYDGDDTLDMGRFMSIINENGDPVYENMRASYEVYFENNIPNMGVGCCDGVTVSEGDLDGDGRDEMSIFQAPENGCNFSMSTYSLKNGEWKQVIAPFLFPSECENVTGEVLKSLIVKEGDKIFIMETDFNDKNFTRHKKEVKLL